MQTQLPNELTTNISSLIKEFEHQFGFAIAWAIRSSGVAEDLQQTSFAGQYDTILGSQTLNEIEEAIKRCWASFLNPRSIIYRRDNGIFEIQGALILQRLISSSSAGVAFTIDPITGKEDNIVINSNFGLGESVVSGHVTPDQFIVAKKDFIILKKDIHQKDLYTVIESNQSILKKLDLNQKNKSSLTEKEILAVADLAYRVECFQKCPVDIEWAFENGELYLLQARPVTTSAKQASLYPPEDWAPDINTPIDPRFPLYSSGNIGEVMPGCMTPLSWSINGPGLEQGFREVLKSFKTMEDVGPQFIVIGFFFHRLYLNVSYFVEAAKRSEAADPKTVFDELVGKSEIIPRNEELQKKNKLFHWRKIRKKIHSYLTAMQIQSQMPAKIELAKKAYQEKRKRELSDDFRSLPLRQIVLPLLDFQVVYIHLLVSQFAQSNLAILNQLTAKWLNDQDHILAKTLITGIGTISAQPTWKIYELSRQILAEPKLLTLFNNEKNDKKLYFILSQEEAPEYKNFYENLTHFLNAFGHRGICETELRNFNWNEDPSQVINLLRSYLAENMSSPEEIFKQQKQASLETRRRVLSHLPWYKRLILNQVIDKTRQFIADREEMKDYVIRMCDLSRQKVKLIQKHLINQNIIASEDEVYFLLWNEIINIAQGKLEKADVTKIIERRKRDFLWSQMVSVPKIQEGKPVFTIEQPVANENTFSGIGVSPGIAEGPAKVILDPRLGYNLVKGEILVAPITDLAWTPLFVNAAGLIVEIGRPLSHGSIVAREYGIPAVTAIANATRVIQTGDIVRVNGSEGLITIIKRSI